MNGGKAFKLSKELNELDFRGKKVSSCGVALLYDALADNRSVRVLNMGGCELDVRAQSFVMRALRTAGALETLDLDGVRIDGKIAVKFVEALQQAPRLRAVVLARTGLAGDAVEKLPSVVPRCANIDRLDLSGVVVPGGTAFDALLQSSLSVLKLNRCGLGEEAASVVAGALGKSQTISELELGENAWGTGGIVAILRAAGDCVSLRRLVVSAGAQQRGLATADVVTGVAALLTGPSALEELDVRGVAFSEREMTDTVRVALQRNAMVQRLLYDSPSAAVTQAIDRILNMDRSQLAVAPVGSAWADVAREYARSGIMRPASQPQKLAQIRAAAFGAVDAVRQGEAGAAERREAALDALQRVLESVVVPGVSEPLEKTRQWISRLQGLRPRRPVGLPDDAPSWRTVLDAPGDEADCLAALSDLWGELENVRSSLVVSELIGEELSMLVSSRRVARYVEGAVQTAKQGMLAARKQENMVKRELEDAELEADPDLMMSGCAGLNLIPLREAVARASAEVEAQRTDYEAVMWRVARARRLYFPEIPAKWAAFELPRDVGVAQGSLPALYRDLAVAGEVGRSATMLTGRAAENDARVALKQVIDRGPGSPSRVGLIAEVTALQQLASIDGVARITRLFADGPSVYLELPGPAFTDVLEWALAKNRSQAARLAVISQVLTTLAQVHEAGLAHGGIRPESVLIDGDEEPRTRLLNFEGRVDHRLASAYIAPELHGSAADLPTPAADVYAVGVLLVQMMTPGHLRPKAHGPAAVPDVMGAGALASLARKMLSEDAAARPSAEDAAADAALGAAAGVALHIGGPSPPPEYWQCRGGSQRGRGLLDVTAAMLNRIQDLVDRTTLPGSLGVGRDVRVKDTPNYSRLVVKKVERVENLALWRKYSSARSERELEAAARRGGLPPIDAATAFWVRPEDQLVSAVNELFLFHGASWGAVKHITESGFDNRVSQEGAFGLGSYFGENCCKSDQYAADDGEAAGLFALLLCRVTMGFAAITTVQRPSIRRPPCIHDHYGICEHTRADSLLAECKRTNKGVGTFDRHREMIIFELAQAYPEYVITYQRV